MLNPRQVCAAFSKGVQRPVRYVQGPIEIEVPIPNGYREQLAKLDVLFGRYNAPYFGPDLQAPDEALQLWAGFRGMEEYAQEVFPLEEAANGLTWMNRWGKDDCIGNGVEGEFMWQGRSVDIAAIAVGLSVGALIAWDMERYSTFAHMAIQGRTYIHGTGRRRLFHWRISGAGHIAL